MSVAQAQYWVMPQNNGATHVHVAGGGATINVFAPAALSAPHASRSTLRTVRNVVGAALLAASVASAPWSLPRVVEGWTQQANAAAKAVRGDWKGLRTAGREIAP
jgi:hypothetical protein